MKNIIIAASLLLAGCFGGSTTDNIKVAKPSFKMVDVPTALSSPDARAEYLATHYWDNFDFTDTSYIHLPEITEQAFTDYIAILQYAKPSSAYRSVKSLLSRAESDSTMFAYFTELSDKYLYDPNSPMRNEELYIPVLEYIVGSSKVDQVMKIRPEQLLELAQKNRPGRKANDFAYTTISGANSNLHSHKSDYVLIFFNNPGCHACKEIMVQTEASELITKLLKDKRLTILAIYPDKEIDEWRNYAPNIPKSWINAYDPSHKLIDLNIYDLKAIPTLYLLDKDKNVMLKDATFDQIQQMLVYNEDN